MLTNNLMPSKSPSLSLRNVIQEIIWFSETCSGTLHVKYDWREMLQLWFFVDIDNLSNLLIEAAWVDCGTLKTFPEFVSVLFFNLVDGYHLKSGLYFISAKSRFPTTFALWLQRALCGKSQKDSACQKDIYIIFFLLCRRRLIAHNWSRTCSISQQHMMTSANGKIFRVTGLLCGVFIGHRWIPRTKASDAEQWCFLWSAPE